MIKIFLFAGLTASVFVCNNSGTDNTRHDSKGHAEHSTSNSDPKSANATKALHQAMNKMMQDMHNTKPTGDADYDFALMMKLHHQSAVEMARVLVENSTDSKIKQHAQHTIEEQQKEIGAFDKFLQKTKPTGQSDYGHRAMKMMSAMDDSKMEMGSIETMYASMMIPHHQDGVKMAEEYVKVSNNEDLKGIARSIIQTQPKEIEDYKQWLSDRKQH